MVSANPEEMKAMLETPDVPSQQQRAVLPIPQPLSAEEEAKINHAKAAEDAKFSADCDICMSTMVEPVTLPCKHSFCIICLREFWKQKTECPMCRAVPTGNFVLKVDKKLQNQVKKAEPGAYAEQIAELRKVNAVSEDFVDLKITLGNKHCIDKPTTAKGKNLGNQHRWTMFVKIACQNK